MKKILFIISVVFVAACGNSTPKQEASATKTEVQYFGNKITDLDVKPIADLTSSMGDQKEIAIKLEAPIDAVCQKKGCWMDLKTADGKSMRVTFKDYAFFVPKDATGKTAIVEGVAKIEETSVADLQEYAKDAGKSDEEIAAITSPKEELVFEASGVIIK